MAMVYLLVPSWLRTVLPDPKRRQSLFPDSFRLPRTLRTDAPLQFPLVKSSWVELRTCCLALLERTLRVTWTVRSLPTLLLST